MIDSVKNHLYQSGFVFEVILLERVKDLTILNEFRKIWSEVNKH